MNGLKMNGRRILVIAGSDSSGGAGLEADQKVIAVHGCYAMTATTALTAQDTTGVHDIHVTPPAFVEKQINACIEDIGIDVVKIGMLASAETVRVVASTLRKHPVAPIVLDPVMVSTSGAQLLPEDAVRSLREELLPLTTVLTPNIPEARLLLRDARYEEAEIRDLQDLKNLADAVQRLGPKYVLLKGGHLPLSRDGRVATTDAEKYSVVDVLSGGGRTYVIESSYVRSKNTHGTGCSLASAIAANMLLQKDIATAVKAASRYVGAGIRTSLELGKGNGPINHFHSSYMLPFAQGHFVEWLLDREDVQRAWTGFTEHKFVAGLADGTLPLKAFQFYLVQDYLYLIHFSRANALAAYKADNMEDISMSASIVTHIHQEMKLHLDYCEGFGLSKEDIEKHEESQACTAYTRYMLDVGLQSDWLALQMVIAPCLLGYGAIGRKLYDDPQTLRDGNPYWKWIENYVADDYTQAVDTGSELLEKHAMKQSPSKIEQLVKIFIHATKMETGFWDMGAAGG